MTNLYSGKNILILGFGVTGKEVLKTCLELEANKIYIYDENEIDFAFSSNVELYNDDAEISVIIKSPGIKMDHPLLVKYNNVKVINDIELAYELVNEETKIIAVTGTNGKSTFVSLLTKILADQNYDAFACGNIGISPLKVLREEKNIDYLVLGCSHYPYLIPKIKEILPKSIQIIDSGEAVAKQTLAVLQNQTGISDLKKGKCEFYSNVNPKVLDDILENKYSVTKRDF